MKLLRLKAPLKNRQKKKNRKPKRGGYQSNLNILQFNKNAHNPVILLVELGNHSENQRTKSMFSQISIIAPTRKSPSKKPKRNKLKLYPGQDINGCVNKAWFLETLLRHLKMLVFAYIRTGK